MSARATATATARIADRAKAVPDADRGHRIRLYSLYVLASRPISPSLSTALTITNYRPSIVRFRPSITCCGPAGRLGCISASSVSHCSSGIFLYPIRKHWAWLAQFGNTRHWLDIHVLLGLTAPFIIAFHSTLKFRGIAGMAFWIMFAVSVSGVVGRYLYAQIPRKVTTAELSMKELQELQESLSQQLAAQKLLPEADLRALCCACRTRTRGASFPSSSRWST